MPNNPSHIESDYNTGEKEQAHFVDPGNFGAERHMGHPKAKLYSIVAAIILAILAIVVIPFAL